MTESDRGRVHLEALLGRAEKVVRLSPADVLVLMGAEYVDDPSEFGSLFEAMKALGIEAAGMVVLGQGTSIDSIDMHQLVKAYAAAGAAPAGSQFKVVNRLNDHQVETECPRGCGATIPLPVAVLVGDTGQKMAARAEVDNSDLELHEMVCTGNPSSAV